MALPASSSSALSLSAESPTPLERLASSCVESVSALGAAAAAQRVLLGVEGGGTTFRVALCPLHAPDDPRHTRTVPTHARAQRTLKAVRRWIMTQLRRKDVTVCGVGVACFGPIQPTPGRPDFGAITTTPKEGWENVNVIAALLGPDDSDVPDQEEEEDDVERGEGDEEEEEEEKPMNEAERRQLVQQLQELPFRFDTDVNAPAMAEYRMNNLPETSSCVYITVGTGVGVGLVVNGESVNGMLHPEGGHLLLARKAGDTFEGTCARHGNCVEGLVGAHALAKRAGVPRDQLASLPDDHEVWDYAAHTLASLCASLVLTVSPERIVLSGGVMQRESLFPRIRTYVREILRGYVQTSEIMTDEINDYIAPSPWGNDAGIIGALTLAQEAYFESKEKKSRAKRTMIKNVSTRFFVTLGACILIPTVVLLSLGLLGKPRKARRR